MGRRQNAEKKENERGGEAEPRCGAKGQHGSPNKSVAGPKGNRVNPQKNPGSGARGGRVENEEDLEWRPSNLGAVKRAVNAFFAE